MTTKATIIILRIITGLLSIRVLINAILEGNMLLLIIAGFLALLFFKMPQIIKSI